MNHFLIACHILGFSSGSAVFLGILVWLQRFPKHRAITLSYAYFFAVISLYVSVATIRSYQAINLAIGNPVAIDVIIRLSFGLLIYVFPNFILQLLNVPRRDQIGRTLLGIAGGVIGLRLFPYTMVFSGTVAQFFERVAYDVHCVTILVVGIGYPIYLVWRYYRAIKSDVTRAVIKRFLAVLTIPGIPIVLLDMQSGAAHHFQSTYLFGLTTKMGGVILLPELYLMWNLMTIWYAVKMVFPKSIEPSSDYISEFGGRYGLTNREIEIVGEILKGKANNDISQDLFISLPTVKTHTRKIFQKMNIGSRYELFTLYSRDTKTH